MTNRWQDPMYDFFANFDGESSFAHQSSSSSSSSFSSVFYATQSIPMTYCPPPSIPVLEFEFAAGELEDFPYAQSFDNPYGIADGGKSAVWESKPVVDNGNVASWHEHRSHLQNETPPLSEEQDIDFSWLDLDDISDTVSPSRIGSESAGTSQLAESFSPSRIAAEYSAVSSRSPATVSGSPFNSSTSASLAAISFCGPTIEDTGDSTVSRNLTSASKQQGINVAAQRFHSRPANLVPEGSPAAQAADLNGEDLSDNPVLILVKSDINNLYDGYSWRKYGEKKIKNRIHPRSYYRCAQNGCSVQKHIERSSENSEYVMTTYHGRHNHQI